MYEPIRPYTFSLLYPLTFRVSIKLGVNLLAIVFLFLAGFFLLDVFHDYVYTFMTIEACAAGGSILACFFWGLHRKYKSKDGQAKTMKELGVI